MPPAIVARLALLILALPLVADLPGAGRRQR